MRLTSGLDFVCDIMFLSQAKQAAGVNDARCLSVRLAPKNCSWPMVTRLAGYSWFFLSFLAASATSCLFGSGVVPKYRGSGMVGAGIGTPSSGVST